MNVSHFYAIDRFRIYQLSPSKSGYGEKCLNLLTSHIPQLPARFNLVMVDSVTTLVNNMSAISEIDFFIRCKALCSSNRSVILVAGSHALEKTTLSRVYKICDYYLQLKSDDIMLRTGQIEDRPVKTLSLLKQKGIEKQSGQCKFEIKAKVGIEILPIFNVKI